MPFKDPEAGRAYRATRYQARKAEFLAQHKARYEAKREEIRAKQKRYYENNTSKILQQQHTHNKARMSYIVQRNREWRVLHQEHMQQYYREYYLSHKDQYLEHQARRKARLLNAPLNDLTKEQWREIKAAYDYRCVYCGHKQAHLTQDHITPLARGGSHTLANVVPACGSCNSRKRLGSPIVPVQPLLLTIATKKA